MVALISCPELLAGCESDAESLGFIEIAEAGIVADKQFNETLWSPQTGKVSTAAMDIHWAEIHAVDVDKREYDVVVLIFIPQNVSRGEVFVYDTFLVHVSREGSEGFGYGLVDGRLRRSHLIEQMLVGTFGGDEPALSQQAPAAILHISDGLRCADAVLSQDRGILEGAYALRLAQVPGIDKEVDETGAVITLHDERLPVRQEKALDEVPLAVIDTLPFLVHTWGKAEEKVLHRMIAVVEK